MAPSWQPPPGSATDIQFLRLMIPHHTMAMRESKAALPSTVHDKLTDLQLDVVRSQLHEIRLMRTWLHAWFA